MSIREPLSFPISFDWRDYQGNWLTEVKNQGLCGSCWSFCAVAQTESWWKLKLNRPYLEVDLSEQFILSCSEGSCIKGRISGALYQIQTDGKTLDNTPSHRSLIPTPKKTIDDDKVAWMGISNHMGMINGYDSILIDIKLKSNSLDPGHYERIICITSNDSKYPKIYIRLKLKVDQPNTLQHTDPNQKPFIVKQNYPNPFNPKTMINYQLRITLT